MSAIFYENVAMNGDLVLSKDSSKAVQFGYREIEQFVPDNVTDLPVGSSVTMRPGMLIYKSTVGGDGYPIGYYIGTKIVDAGEIVASDWKRVALTADPLTAHASTHKSGGSDAIRLDELANPTASVNLNSQRVINLLDPSGDQDAATKAYVDAARVGLNIKDPVRVATTATLACSQYSSGVLTTSANNFTSIDGIILALGDRVLVKNNVTCTSPSATNSAVYNGIYTVSQVSTGSLPLKLTRAIDFDGVTANTLIGSNGEVKTGASTWVNEGTANGSSRWTLATLGTIVVGSIGDSGVSSLVFVKDFQGKDLNATATSGITYSTPDISVKAGNGISVNVNGVNVKPNPTNPTIAVDSDGVKVNFNAAQFQATANGLELKPIMKSYWKKVELTSVNMANSKISGSANNVIDHGLQYNSGTSNVDVTPTTVDFYDKKGNQVFFEVITLSTTQVTFTSTTNITLGVAGTATNIFMVTSYVG